MDAQVQSQYFMRLLVDTGKMALHQLEMLPIWPIERVQTVLQLQGSKAIKSENPYTNTFDAFKRMYKDMGILSFLRGSSALIAKAIWVLPSYPLFSLVMDRVFEALEMNTAASVLYILTANALLWPFETAQTQMTCDLTIKEDQESKDSDKKLKVLTTMENITSKRGFLGLYAGYSARIILLFSSNVFLQFCIQTLDRYRAVSMLTWNLATVSAVIFVHPLMVVSKTQQLEAHENSDSIFTCTKKIYDRAGLKGFYGGIGLAISKAVGKI